MNLKEQLFGIIDRIRTEKQIDVDGPGADEQLSTRTIRVDTLKADLREILVDSSRINIAILITEKNTYPFVHRTEEGLREYLNDYCVGQWDSKPELSNILIPKDPAEITIMYFHEVKSETLHTYFGVEIKERFVLDF